MNHKFAETTTSEKESAMSYRIEHDEIHDVDTTPSTPLPPPAEPPRDVIVHREVVEAVPAVAPHTESVHATTRRHFAFDAIVAAAVGVALLLFGLIAIVRAGFDGPNSEPVVDVLGFDHTTNLGLIEIGLGLGLLLAGAFASRAAAIFFAAILAIGGFVAAVETDSFRDDLAIESSFAWLMVAAGALVILVSLLVPRVARTTTSSATTSV
jgi:uncharacterized membrane protein HdeD (DUF308 family)